MRVYHFLNEEFGLADLRQRRLKIANLNELNDPFEFLSVNLSDLSLRGAFHAMKAEIAKKAGLLCFSRDWHNPVQWSHYAAKHTGICLGFEIPDEHLGAISYSRKRLIIETESFRNPQQVSPDAVIKFLYTKYAHWRYEKEVRCFVTLEDKDPENGLYFAEFNENRRLTTVIVGAQSRIARAELYDVLGDLAPTVETFKARLAFKTFRVVRQRNAKLWG